MKPQETQEYPVMMSLDPPEALMNNRIGTVDNTQYDPINKWRAISSCVVIKPQGTRRIEQK
ncbi:MAG TPA: hypothetical protein VL854_08250 [Nitrososphaeraceae archaeon]|nr:hypothetical protein [Nitrososphaeraceae archaeon]